MKKGISLVALVVTIIVLVILAGTVVLTMMDDSILDKANTAKNEQNKNEVFSAIQREVLNVQAENIGLQVGEEFAQKLQTKLNDKYKGANITTTYNETTGKIDIGYKLNEKEYSLTLNNKYQLSIEESENGESEETELAINDERVIELLTIYLDSGGLSETEVLELKQELHIDNVESNLITDILFSLYDPKYEDGIIYFYTIDRMYVVDIETFQIRYVSKEERLISYKYAQKMEQILSELKVVFVEEGKTENEIEVLYNNGTLNSYVLGKCTSIKTINVIYDATDSFRRTKIRELTFEFDEPEYKNYNFCEWSTFYFELDDNGKYIDIYLEMGT